MRQIFYLGVLFFIILSVVGAGIFLFGRALYTVYSDWRLGKELDELKVEMRQRHARREAAGEPDTGEIS